LMMAFMLSLKKEITLEKGRDGKYQLSFSCPCS
jgi:hypothetical protein